MELGFTLTKVNGKWSDFPGWETLGDFSTWEDFEDEIKLKREDEDEREGSYEV